MIRFSTRDTDSRTFLDLHEDGRSVQFGKKRPCSAKVRPVSIETSTVIMA